MSINISTKQLEPLRTNYANLERRFGNKKPASRYQEAVYDIQPTVNFHYPPSWEPNKKLFDVTRTAIVMEDWYRFADPRQYYYTAYVSARAKQQESIEKTFEMIEKRGLLNTVPTELQQKIRQVLTPLRHVEYGANMNNQDICDRGYGATITSLASFNGFDRIGMAQYLSRIALLVDENEESGLIQAREDWLNNPVWQPLRHAMEDIFVLDDWFEIMVAQNVVMDGLIFPLMYEHFINEVSAQGAGVFAMLTQLMTEWYAETIRWTNQLMKVTASESPENAQLLSHWVAHWTDRLSEAVTPIAELALDDKAEAALSDVKQTLLSRLGKQGILV